MTNRFEQFGAPEPAGQAPAAPAPAPGTNRFAEIEIKLEDASSTDPTLISADAQELDNAPEGSVIDAIIEPVKAIGGIGYGSAKAGLEGIMDFVAGNEDYAENIDATQAEYAKEYAPKTQSGQESLATIGDIVEAGYDNFLKAPLSLLGYMGEMFAGQSRDQAVQTMADVKENGFGKVAGSRVFEETQSPLAATVAETSPEIVSSMIGIGRSVSNIKGTLMKRSNLQTKLAEQIKSGGTENQLAKYVVTGSSSLKNDPLTKPLLIKGFDQGALAAVKGSTASNKAKLLKMLEIKRQGKENTLYAVKNRPSDVAGDSLIERVRYVQDVNKKAGQQLGIEAKNLKGQKVDFSGPINRFESSLDEMGIGIGKDFKPVFTGSDIEGATAAENAISKIVARLASGKRGYTPDAYELHRLKKYIDETVTYGKAGEGLAGKAESIMKQLRHDVDAVLDENFPAYNAVNTTYADTVSALDALQDVAGRKMNLSGANADKATGTLLRRMMSNAQSRVNLVDAVDDLERTAIKYGGEFDDDIAVQMLFADELDTVFGASARTSLQGDVAKSVQQGLDAATGNKSMLRKAVGAAKTGVKKMMEPEEEKTFRLMKEMLER